MEGVICSRTLQGLHTDEEFDVWSLPYTCSSKNARSLEYAVTCQMLLFKALLRP